MLIKGIYSPCICHFMKREKFYLHSLFHHHHQICFIWLNREILFQAVIIFHWVLEEVCFVSTNPWPLKLQVGMYGRGHEQTKAYCCQKYDNADPFCCDNTTMSTTIVMKLKMTHQIILSLSYPHFNLEKIFGDSVADGGYSFLCEKNLKTTKDQ